MFADAQRGVALVTALLVVAFATIVAATMASRQQLDLRRTTNVLDTERSYLFALGVESWAAAVLARDLRDGQTDHFDEDWATVLPVIAVEGGAVSGHLEDMQGRFNLNNLVTLDAGKLVASPPDVARFQRLLDTLGINPELAEAVVDWLDSDIEPTFPNGAEDDAYAGLDPPYRTANTLMASPSELMLIQGVSPAIYQQLAPFVATLPSRVTINVNTAPAEVLRCLTDNISSSDADTLIDARPFNAVADFTQQPALQGRTLDPATLGVASAYFLVAGHAEFGRGRVDLFSLLERAAGQPVRAVMRGQGIY